MNSNTSGSGVERISGTESEEFLALIIPGNYSSPGIGFVTDDESVHQLGVLCWPKGHVIDAHVHNPVFRTTDSTQEVLLIRSGRVRLDLYSSDKTYVCSRELATGDVVLLAAGGHGLEMLEASEIVEVKQGPYVGEQEKTRFAPQDNPHFQRARHA